MAPDLKRIYSFTDEQIYFQNDKRNFLRGKTQSFWRNEDLVKKLDAQTMIFKNT